MTMFKVFTTENAPAPSNDTLKGLEKSFGFVPNVFAVMADAPAALNAFIAMNNLFAQTSLTPTEREVVQLTVSVENDCVYCVAGHTAFAKQFGVDEGTVACVRDMDELEDPKLRALQVFTRSLLQSRGHIDEAELQAFFDAGYTTQKFHEVTLGICVKVFSNIASIATKIPLDEQFFPYAWQKPNKETPSVKTDQAQMEEHGVLELYGIEA